MWKRRDIIVKEETQKIEQLIQNKRWHQAIRVAEIHMLKGYLIGKNKAKHCFPELANEDFNHLHHVVVDNPYNNKLGMKLYLIKEIEQYYQKKLRILKLKELGF